VLPYLEEFPPEVEEAVIYIEALRHTYGSALPSIFLEYIQKRRRRSKV